MQDFKKKAFEKLKKDAFKTSLKTSAYFCPNNDWNTRGKTILQKY